MSWAQLQHELPAIVLGLVLAIPLGLLLIRVFKHHWMSWFASCFGLAIIYLGLSSIAIDPEHRAAFAFAAMRWFAFGLLIFSFIQFRRARRRQERSL